MMDNQVFHFTNSCTMIMDHIMAMQLVTFFSNPLFFSVLQIILQFIGQPTSMGHQRLNQIQVAILVPTKLNSVQLFPSKTVIQFFIREVTVIATIVYCYRPGFRKSRCVCRRGCYPYTCSFPALRGRKNSEIACSRFGECCGYTKISSKTMASILNGLFLK